MVLSSYTQVHTLIEMISTNGYLVQASYRTHHLLERHEYGSIFFRFFFHTHTSQVSPVIGQRHISFAQLGCVRDRCSKPSQLCEVVFAIANDGS